jgi:succinate dehydrogenase / fumarate reductase flavoprotein subunit
MRGTGQLVIQGYDVLVIGSGGAALRAAIEAKEEFPQGSVALITKGRLGESGVTAKACSDRMAFHATLEYTEPGGTDNWRYHADDVFRIGGYVSDEDLAVILAKNSANAITYLADLGVSFAKKPDGRIDQFVTDGSLYARAAYTGPYTAVDIEKALVRKARSLDIKVFEDHLVTSLLTNGTGRVVGAVGLGTDSDSVESPVQIMSKCVIIATGGAGQVFQANVFPPENTGDGYAMAYEIGAELTNMEFIQIGIASVATGLACSGSVMRCIPRFVNDEGEEFLLRYLCDLPPEEIYDLVFEKGATWPLQSEHPGNRIDVAVYREVNAGKRVFVDFSQNPRGFHWDKLSSKWKDRYMSEVRQSLGAARRYESPILRYLEINPKSVQWFKDAGVDLVSGDQVEIVNAVQHFQGGIRIRTRAETNIPGLFAVGEAAGGQHGANRPGGHALLDCQVFGRIAGEEAANQAKSMTGRLQASNASITQALARITRLRNGPGVPAHGVRLQLQKIMSDSASVVRTDNGLAKAVSDLAELQSAGVRTDERGIAYAVETENMLRVGEMILRAARMRLESRGPHLLFPSYDSQVHMPRDDDWNKYIVIYKGEDGSMKLTVRQPVRVNAWNLK